MGVVARVQRTSIAGEPYDIAVAVTELVPGIYTARSLICREYGSGDTPEKAIESLENIINSNHPAQFELMPEKEQGQLLAWVKEHLMPGVKGSSKQYNSYYLKHVAERSIGWYIDNGQMKGALLQAGYDPTKDNDQRDINWLFMIRRGLPEKIDKESRARGAV